MPVQPFRGQEPPIAPHFPGGGCSNMTEKIRERHVLRLRENDDVTLVADPTSAYFADDHYMRLASYYLTSNARCVPRALKSALTAMELADERANKAITRWNKKKAIQRTEFAMSSGHPEILMEPLDKEITLEDLIHRETESGLNSPSRSHHFGSTFLTEGSGSGSGSRGGSRTGSPNNGGNNVGAGGGGGSSSSQSASRNPSKAHSDLLGGTLIGSPLPRPGSPTMNNTIGKSAASKLSAITNENGTMVTGPTCPALGEAVLNQARSRLMLCCIHSQAPLEDHPTALKFAYEANLLIDQFWANECDLVVNKEYWRTLATLKGQVMKSVAIEASFCNMPKQTQMSLWQAVDKYLTTNEGFLVFEKDPPSLDEREEQARIAAEEEKKRKAAIRNKMKGAFNKVRAMSSVSLGLKKALETSKASSSATSKERSSVMSSATATKESHLPGRGNSKGRAGQIAGQVSEAGGKLARMNDDVKAFLEVVETPVEEKVVKPVEEARPGPQGIYQRAMARLEQKNEKMRISMSRGVSPISNRSSRPNSPFGTRGKSPKSPSASAYTGSGGAVPGSTVTILKQKGLEPGKRLEDEDVSDAYRNWSKAVKAKKKAIVDRANASYKALSLMPDFSIIKHSLTTPSEQQAQSGGATGAQAGKAGNIFVDFKAAAALAAREALGAATAASTQPGVGTAAASSRANYRQWRKMAKDLNQDSRMDEIYMDDAEFFNRKVFYSGTGFGSMKRRRVLPGMKIQDLVRQQNLILGGKKVNLNDLKQVMTHHLRQEEFGDLQVERNRKKCISELRKDYEDATLARREYRICEAQFNKFKDYWRRKRQSKRNKGRSTDGRSTRRSVVGKNDAMGLAGPGDAGQTQPQTTLLDSSDSDPEAFSLSKIKGKGDMMEQAVQEEAAHKEETVKEFAKEGFGDNVKFARLDVGETPLGENAAGRQNTGPTSVNTAQDPFKAATGGKSDRNLTQGFMGARGYMGGDQGILAKQLERERSKAKGEPGS